MFLPKKNAMYVSNPFGVTLIFRSFGVTLNFRSNSLSSEKIK